MSNLIILEIEHETPEQDLSVKLLIEEDGKLRDTGIRGILASAATVVEVQECWREAYKATKQPSPSRAPKRVPTQTTAIGNQVVIACQKLAQEFDNRLNEWLSLEQFYPFKQELEQLLKSLEPSGETRVLVKTNEPEMRRLPWHLWNVFQRYSCEVGLSLTQNKRVERPNPPKPRARLRILPILGDDTGINTQADEELLRSLADVEPPICLKKPKRRDLYQELWNPSGWDILFFAGHSASEANGDSGRIFINETEGLSIGELKNALRFAIGLGLKLAIFNSCDGLGLARELADLYIPHLIVFREPVPDPVAQEFLKHFLTAYSGGKSLYNSVWEARQKLQPLEKDFPCATWLPVICQNPADAPLTWQELRGNQTEASWQACCRAMLGLAAHTRLLNNPLTNDELGFELEEIYIPLGLVERTKPERRRDNVSPEQGSQLYQPEPEYKVTKIFQQQEFFDQVLRQGQSPKSQGRRLVFIGEPGAGKTKLLHKVGDWVLDNTTEDVPIWISLADLQGKSLEAYLRENWLEKAMETVRLPGGTTETFEQLFQSGKVWLLLDGVDELTTASANPIVELVNQLTDWVSQTRLVLTCRLNLWETGKEALENFDVYRNLDFSYGDTTNPDQVKQFIGRWFHPSPALGDRLRVQLDEQGRERIRDLVKNPLRLSLLCRTWQWKRGSLPRTKAELYRQFTEAVYEWKQRVFQTTPEQQQELNKALSQLARRALDQEASRFRLRHHLVAEELGEFDSPLFQLALQLGWLNQVGVAAENPEEKVYAFFHPTFQEYFAAQAIADWQYFLRHNNDSPNLEQGTYRIFERQWREVVLLWLGREDIFFTIKEEFLEALLGFQDGCGSFYEWQAFFLAAAGSAEFEIYSRAREIVAQTVNRSCCGSISIQDPRTFLSTIQEEAKIALRAADRGRTIQELTGLLTSQDVSVRFQAAAMLVELAPDNRDAIQCLSELISQPQYIGSYLDARSAESLEKIGIGNSNIIEELQERLRISHDENVRLRIARCLGKINPGNSIAIDTLIHLINNSQQVMNRNRAISYLGEIGTGNQGAVNTLLRLIRTSLDNLSSNTASLLLYAVANLGKIGTGNSDAVATLIKLLQSRFEELRLEAAESLVKINASISDVSACLTTLLNTTRNEGIRLRAAQCLLRIDPNSLEAIANLSNLIHTSAHSSVLRWATDSLEAVNSDRSESVDILIQRLRTSLDEEVRQATAESLGRIDPGNLEAVNTLIDLLRNGRGALIPYDAVSSLKKILQDDLFQVVVSNLRDFLQPVSLGSNDRYGRCYEIVWHCAENLAYPDFYRAWYTQPQPLTNHTANFAAQLQSTSRTYPIFTNAQALTTQQGWVSQFRRLLQVQNIALILYSCEPDPKLVAFYKELVERMPGLYIGWITSTCLDPPLKTFSPEQPNLLNAIQRWIDEIG